MIVSVVAVERVGALVADEDVLGRSPVEDVVPRPADDATLPFPGERWHVRVVRRLVVPVLQIQEHEGDTAAADGVGVLGGAAVPRGDGVPGVVDEEVLAVARNRQRRWPCPQLR
jgi:hypothetical protein